MAQPGEYALGEKIGSGAMGTVVKATAPDGSTVAVKTMYPHLAQVEEFVKRFRREAELAKRLSHPNVVRVLDYGEDDGQQYIVMEYVEGQSLADAMKAVGIGSASVISSAGAGERPPVSEPAEGSVSEAAPASDSFRSRTTRHLEEKGHFPPEKVVKITRQIAGVLQAAADIGLVHRDIKPQNILLDQNGNAKLLDFGLAKDTEALVTMLSMTGQMIGTPPYMSPEQHEGGKEIDVRSDLYSLGATAYHLLTGKPPFPGPTATAYARQHLEEIPEPCVKANPNVPLNLSQVVDRLLAKKPEDRHQTPAELIEDLNRVERGEVPLKLHKPKKSRKHNPLAVWGAVAATVILCVGAFVGYQLYRSGNAKTLVAEAVTDARMLAGKHEYDQAKDALDAVIRDYGMEDPALVKEAETLREKLLAEAAAWREERDRKAEEERKRLIARQEAERKRAEEERKRLAEENRRKAELEAARMAEERKRAAEEAERNRKHELRLGLGKAERLSRNEDTVDEALKLLDEKISILVRSDTERERFEALRKTVQEKYASRRPLVAVVDFTIDANVNKDVTGYAVATLLEDALSGRYRRVARGQIKKALEELKFQSSDLSDSSKAKRLGRMIGAEFLVSGSVVRMGDGMSIISQIFNVETGAIKQSARVTSEDVNEFNNLFRELATILSMSDAEKRTYMDEKFNYPKHLADGKSLMNAGDFAGAVKALKRALRAKKTPEAELLLKQAEVKAEEARIKAERKARYETAMTEGRLCLEKRDWPGAEAKFKEALAVPGYEDDGKASQGVRTARGGAEALRKAKLKQKYDDLVSAGRKLLEAEKWTEAEAKFQEAVQCGHDETATAEEGVKTARGGAELKRRRREAETKCALVLKSAQDAYDQAKTLEKDSANAWRLCDQALSALGSDLSDTSDLSDSSKTKLSTLKNNLENLKATLKPPGPSEGQNWTIPDLGAELVWVAPGSFDMGSNDGDSDEKPVHRVTISKGFWMGKHEVTQREYEAVMGRNPSQFKGSDNPVERVSWNDAVSFCEKLTERERSAGRLPSGVVYRLPTEAEWEYAARGGEKSRGFKYSGSNDLDDVGWYGDNSGKKTHPVGQKQPNELGIYDMSDNVWEWCYDWYGDYPSGGVTDPSGPSSGSDRVNRGGSWLYASWNCRVANRSGCGPSLAFGNFGFRVLAGQKK